MRSRSPRVFRSPLAPFIEAFLTEKRALGYKYGIEEEVLRRLDAYLVSAHHPTADLPRHVVEPWIASRAYERPRTRKLRIQVTRMLAMSLVRDGVPAFVAGRRMRGLHEGEFTPYILTRKQVRALLDAVDGVQHRTGLRRHLVLPVLFRTLYGCGLRVSEALNLTRRDFDAGTGVLRVRQGKFGKDRLVPTAPSLRARISQLDDALGRRGPDAPLLPSRTDARIDQRRVYWAFRNALRDAGVAHGGRGRGPRVHDLRHTFAVHRLESWLREGHDVQAKLPILSVYLGHRSIYGTQIYLRLTSELFPDVTRGFEKIAGHLVPGALFR